eukprot:GHRR01033435.1.p2 GENE.GHRR01033435.1~~GHRR01033435.1.p2  ORF type:complete len:138 (+),score=46.59 GHRR01033435.1:808-1221(+)
MCCCFCYSAALNCCKLPSTVLQQTLTTAITCSSCVTAGSVDIYYWRCCYFYLLLLQFTFSYAAEDPKNSLKLLFKRRTDVMPPPPKATKHHPSSVVLELVKRLIHDTRATTLAAFLQREFDQVNKALAGRLEISEEP